LGINVVGSPNPFNPNLWPNLGQFGTLFAKRFGEGVVRTPKGGLTMAERKPKERKDKREDGEDTTEFDNFQEVLEEVLSVPKEELDKRRAEYEREKKEKQAG
jgi:hypothetical protein